MKKEITIIRRSISFFGIRRYLIPFAWINCEYPIDFGNVAYVIYNEYGEYNCKEYKDYTIYPLSVKVKPSKLDEFSRLLQNYYSMAEKFGYDFSGLSDELESLFKSCSYEKIKY